MPLNSDDSERIGARLAQRAATGADPRQLADAIVLTWRGVNAALGPIIGPASVALLYRRSLQQAAPAHPWLAEAGEGERTPMDMEALHGLLTRQSSEQVAAAGGQVFKEFYELLASLIGLHLTEQLLQTVWENPLHGASTQESTP